VGHPGKPRTSDEEEEGKAEQDTDRQTGKFAASQRFPASQSEPTQHEHMAETTTTEPGGITPAQARAV